MTLDRLAALAVKKGVSLGGLPEPDRLLALAVCARSIAPGARFTEAEANLALKRCLANEAAFLATDHVELRRWLVDAGWWSRDVAGRSYHCLPTSALRDELRAVAEALACLDLPTWMGRCRDAARAQRARRQAEWAARQS